jgi:hypothetical protein
MVQTLLPALVVFAFPLALRAQAAGQVYNQPTTGDRLVVMEAENAQERVGNAETWTLATTATAPAAPATYGGGGAMVALPNDNSGNDSATTYVNGPRLGFKVAFRTTGTHYVWIRGRALDQTTATPSQPPGNNDSCHVALDGVATTTGYQISGFVATEWRWRTLRNGNLPATVEVATTGVHTLGVYMREDGLLIDRVLITTNAAYAPNPVTATGPAETGQIADTIPVPVVLSGSPVPAGVSLSWTASPNASSYTLEIAPATGNTWTVRITQPGTTYTDLALVQAQTYRYRVFANKDSINLGVGPSNVLTIQPGDPLPRTAGSNDEGLVGDNCAFGSSILGAGGTSILPLAGLLLALAARRRRP